MQVERFTTHDGLVLYRLYSARERTVTTVEPGELMALQRWLQEHEDEITTNATENRTREEMEGM